LFINAFYLCHDGFQAFLGAFGRLHQRQKSNSFNILSVHAVQHPIGLRFAVNIFRRQLLFVCFIRRTLNPFYMPGIYLCHDFAKQRISLIKELVLCIDNRALFHP
jgi:hypothetical protein